MTASNATATAVAAPVMVDLDNFDTVTRANSGVDMELKLLSTGRGSGAFITLLGSDSDTFRALREERSRMIEERVLAGQKASLNEDERVDFLCDMFAKCTLGWRGLSKNGALLEFSQDAARKLYKESPAIREQVNVFIGERANFVLA